MIGERIGHFEIVARAGRGGMGEVFIAEQTSIKTRVAIKVLHADVSAHSTVVQRFFNEARAVARIEHAGIVKIFDVGVHRDRAYLIMELLEGETLAARMKRLRRLAPRPLAEIARQIASVLDATHHAEVVHRDLKPDNVFLVRDRELDNFERVKILDFGIAKLSNTLTGPSTVGTLGTPAYMAPEQWGNAGAVDWRADAYSLGCIIYEMAAGRPPFVVTSMAEACAKHLEEIPQPIRSRAPDVPMAIDALALRLLAKDPARRIESMRVLEATLSDIVATAPGQLDDHAMSYAPSAPTEGLSTTLSSANGMSTARSGGRRALWTTGALVVLAGAGVATWRWTRPSATTEVAVPPRPVIAPIDAAREASFAEWLEVANPFVAAQGAHWLAHQVTRREYRRYLETMPVDEALRRAPVTGWDDSDPLRPVAWVTFERAAAFCAAIHARLPSSDEWTRASGGAWGLDPAKLGHPGPLQEWTATVRDGLVVVRGGHDRMRAKELAAAATDELLKTSEAQAGAGAAPTIVASETIGFRCVQ